MESARSQLEVKSSRSLFWSSGNTRRAKPYGLEQIREYRQSPVILDVTAKFLREVHLREQVTIESRLMSYEGKIAKLEQDMVRMDAEGRKTVCCAAVFTMGFFDLETRKLIAPTPLWKRALGLPE